MLKLSFTRLLDLSARLDFKPADRMNNVTQVSSKSSTKHCAGLHVQWALRSGDGLRLGLKRAARQLTPCCDWVSAP